jgi:hypothetical protein
MHYFQNKSADRTSMKRTMKQPPQCMSFTLMFPRLGKAFNYCKMIRSQARWWNDLVFSGDFILFHRVGNNTTGLRLALEDTLLISNCRENYWSQPLRASYIRMRLPRLPWSPTDTCTDTIDHIGVRGRERRRMHPVVVHRGDGWSRSNGHAH